MLKSVLQNEAEKADFTYEGIEYKAMRHAERGPTDLVCYDLEK